MGLFDAIKTKLVNELIDIIEWDQSAQDVMAWKYPRYQNEIKNGARLTVRESQVAVFLNEGKIADVFGPGMHTLNTQNVPILATLQGWKHGFDSPFKADIIFVSTKLFTNMKWGTKNPVMLRDAEFGPIRLRAFGNFAIKVSDPATFIKALVGIIPDLTTEDISENLRNIAVTRGMDAIAESKIPALDLASNYDELSKFIQQKIGPEFAELGLFLHQFLVENISLPPEVEAALDKKSQMNILGNMQQYTQFEAANALRDAAKNEGQGGLAAAGLSAAMGVGMAQNLFAGGMTSSQQPTASVAPPPLPSAVSFFVAVNGAQTGPYSVEQLSAMVLSGQINAQSLVWKAGMANWTALQSVPELQGILSQVPPPLPPAL